jgi:hypothetical protein
MRTELPRDGSSDPIAFLVRPAYSLLLWFSTYYDPYRREREHAGGGVSRARGCGRYNDIRKKRLRLPADCGCRWTDDDSSNQGYPNDREG